MRRATSACDARGPAPGFGHCRAPEAGNARGGPGPKWPRRGSAHTAMPVAGPARRRGCLPRRHAPSPLVGYEGTSAGAPALAGQLQGASVLGHLMEEAFTRGGVRNVRGAGAQALHGPAQGGLAGLEVTLGQAGLGQRQAQAHGLGALDATPLHSLARQAPPPPGPRPRAPGRAEPGSAASGSCPGGRGRGPATRTPRAPAPRPRPGLPRSPRPSPSTCAPAPRRGGGPRLPGCPPEPGPPLSGPVRRCRPGTEPGATGRRRSR